MPQIIRRRAITLLLAAPALALSTRPAFARAPEIYRENGIAIDGSDAVAYFAAKGPVAGRSAHEVTWKSATWRFANAANAREFAARPARFAPQFGGYCALAASKGQLAPTVPGAWTLLDGRLYLNFSLRAREIWLQDRDANIARARANWPGILG